MVASRARSFLSLLLLVVVASIAAADDPPRSCVDTGLTCIESCVGEPNGNYQWCGSCQWFITCTQGNTIYQPCPANLYWHDDVKACVDVSSTCTECIVDTPPNSITENTVTMTTFIAGLCQSTGPDCIDECDQTTNGVYQWCARCDYFLQCSGSTTYYQPCQPGLYYDHSVRACVFESSTCQQCYEDFSTTTPKVDPCASSPCLNAGTCTSNDDGFTCSCPDRYTGHRCETWIDPCWSIPCLNDATCISSSDGSYTCSCPPRYTGILCETWIDPCWSIPCLNDATCISSSDGSYTCSCPPRYTGIRCETWIDPCWSLPCLNDATCISSSDGSYTCSCSDRYTGILCETWIDPCWSFPCLNDATCISSSDGSFTCSCPDRYTGIRCETWIDPCWSFPCLNDATCISSSDGSYTCSCSDRYTGILCETWIDPCLSLPCKNDATCISSSDGSFTCSCPPRYTGILCETFISTCDSIPCLNGGTCNDVDEDTFTCTCPIEWTGFLCESPNYNENFTCGTELDWSGYPASNGFTRLCYFWAPLSDVDGRATECRNTIQEIPLYDDYTGLLTAGGNFGCLVSQNYPEDLPATSVISCADNYQQDVSLGNFTESAILMVCLRYPY